MFVPRRKSRGVSHAPTITPLIVAFVYSLACRRDRQ
jgi:hypothetical protein